MSESKPRRSILQALSAKFSRKTVARQIFVCCGPDCCRREEGEAALVLLRARVSELGLDRQDAPGGGVACSRTGCLGVCAAGPVAYVVPEGTWYRGVSGEGADRIAREDLAEGRTVESLKFNPPPEARPPA